MPNIPQTFESLLQGPAPAALATHRKDGSVAISPVWFRYQDDHFEVVIADDDVKLQHIKRDARVTLLIFESAPPFRGVRVSGDAEITRDGLDETRRSISSRYLSDAGSKAFTENRRGNGIVLRIPDGSARTWDLSRIVT